MKLWQKIFLGTLALMVCCTSLLTLLFVRASWQTVWDQQLVRALTQQQYLARLIKPLGITVSRLASGLPVGGDLEFADEVTLGRALEARQPL